MEANQEAQSAQNADMRKTGYSTSERRVLQSGGVIVKQKRNAETGELYDVDCRLSWGHIYYSCGNGWHRTAKAARLAARVAA